MAVIIFCISMLSSCISFSDNGSTANETEIEDGIFSMINEARFSAGLNELVRQPHLDAIARQYSESEFDDYVKNNTDIRYLLCNSWWVTFTGGPPRLDDDTAREQVDYCLKRESLNQTMMRSDATATGLGVAVRGDTIYYCQVFDMVNVAGGDNEPVTLFDNDKAVDPAWEQLKWFVLSDDTDEQPYIPDSFVCADFATRLHNNAEAAGIRAGYVSVDFVRGPGHALNAFDTTDRGLVFIDCTGQGLNTVISGGGFDTGNTAMDFDKVAYIAEGYEYGIISIDRAYAFDYAFYQQWLLQWYDYTSESETFNEKSDAYEEARDGRSTITDPEEYEQLQAMYKELEELKEELEEMQDLIGDYRWEPLGTVEGIHIQW